MGVEEPEDCNELPGREGVERGWALDREILGDKESSTLVT